VMSLRTGSPIYFPERIIGRLKRRMALLVTAVAAVPVLAGCPLMMPIMMAPVALKAAHDADSEPKRFVNQALQELSANRGGYQIIELGQIETDGHAIPIDEFRKMIIVQMTSSGIRVPEGQHPGHSRGDDMADEYAEASALIDARLTRVESGDRLDLRLKDARSGQLLWEKQYSSLRGTSSGHTH
jgi:hypothetical protein